jgi:hypothetical protein
MLGKTATGADKRGRHRASKVGARLGGRQCGFAMIRSMLNAEMMDT